MIKEKQFIFRRALFRSLIRPLQLINFKAFLEHVTDTKFFFFLRTLTSDHQLIHCQTRKATQVANTSTMKQGL